MSDLHPCFLCQRPTRHGSSTCTRCTELVVEAQRTGGSIAIRRCVGLFAPGCGRVLGVDLWPWSGSLTVETSTVCEACSPAEWRAVHPGLATA